MPATARHRPPRSRAVRRSAGLRAAAFAASTLLAIALAGPAHALDRIRTTFAAAAGDGWSARDVAIDFSLAGPRATITVREARLPAGLGLARGLRIDCPHLETAQGLYRCAAAEVRGEFGALGAQRFTASLEYESGGGAIAIDATGVAVAGGAARVVAALADAGWRARVDATGVDLAAAAALARPWVALPEGFSVAGRATVNATVAGRDAALGRADADLALDGFTIANAAGTLATDGIAAQLSAHVAPAEVSRYAVDLRLATRVGQAYVDPVFVDFAQLPLAAEARALVGGTGPLVIERFAARQADALDVRGRLELDFDASVPLRRADLELDAVAFPAAGVYVAPFLADTTFRNATAKGTVRGRVALTDGAPSRVDLTLDGVDVDEPGGSLAFANLRGRIRWYDDPTRTVVARDDAREAEAFTTRLAWDRGRLAGIALGGASLVLTASGRGFRLLEPARIPVLDGGIAIDTLRMRHIGEPDMWLRLDARVEPISVALISKAFGWPEFGGTISGTIPSAALENDVLTFGGNLAASVFGGHVVASELRLESPLGRFPQLRTNVRIENLDLQQVTGTFSFGEITGRISGRVDALELFGWQPVRFDARFETPPGDRSRRRISQRAVQNLSSIGGTGGGVAAALQTGFLRFFETFRYERLGIACRLENDVCTMGGVGPARGGDFYIVKGSGLPRIDIIGSGDRVAWSRLVQQLAAATESGGAEVR
jgi:hypothetical protein